MFPKQAGHMSRPPSPHQARPTHIPLSIRTSIKTAQTTPQQQGQSSSSSPQPPQLPYPTYPLSISSEKFPKALKLYTKYYLEKGLAQRVGEPQSATEPHGRLNIPSIKRAHSLSSPGSSRAYTPSVSNSAYDGVTATESVVSFTGEESPGSVTANGELISFTGERIKTRVRRPLSPVSKAKAALIRHLESCWVCRSRRVPCPLEHHDIESLETARKAKDRTRQRAKSLHQSRSSDAGSAHARSGFVAEDQAASASSQGQMMTSLLGVGQADQLHDIPPPNPTTQTDSQLSTYENEADLLAEIPSYSELAGSTNLGMPVMPFASAANMDHYTGYQNGDMIPLGVLRGYFYICAHMDSTCQHPFEDVEALQTHFETHLHYNRISPPHRYMCSVCECLNNYSSGPCDNCGTEGTIETWIFGSFIRTPTYQHYRPDGHDYLQNTSSAPFTPSIPGNFSSMDFGMGGGTNNGNFTTGGMNQGGYYNFQNNSFGNGNSQGDNGSGNGNDTPRSSGYHMQGNWARHMASSSPYTARHWYAKALQIYRHHKFILLTILFLVAFTLLFQAHEWVLNKARTFSPVSRQPHPNIPVFGFAGVLGSFATCYTYWSVKKPGFQRAGGTQCRPHRCPLHDLPAFSFHYRQTAPSTFVRSGVFS